MSISDEPYAALSSLIASRILGVAPDDQDLALEDQDWRLIIDALSHKALALAEQKVTEGVTRKDMQPVKVTVSDPDTGAVFEQRIVSNDYVLVTAGNRYLKSINQMGKTHMLAIAVTKPGEQS